MRLTCYQLHPPRNIKSPRRLKLGDWEFKKILLSLQTKYFKVIKLLSIIKYFVYIYYMKNKINKIRKTKFKSKNISNRILELRIHDFVNNLSTEGMMSFSLIFDSNWLYSEQSLRGKGEIAPNCEYLTSSNNLI